MTAFLTAKIQPISCSNRENIQTYLQTIKEISCSIITFENFVSNAIKYFLDCVEDIFYPLLFNTHHIESIVNYLQYIDSTKRSEFFRSLYTIIRSTKVHTFNWSSIEYMKGKVTQVTKKMKDGLKVSGKRKRVDGIDEDDNSSP